MASILRGGVAALAALLASVLLSACGGGSSSTQIPANVTVVDAHSAAFNNSTSVAGTRLYTWGYNAFGQLGNNDNKKQTTSVAAPVPNLGTVNLVSTGGVHTLAAFKNNTTVKSFGSNDHGQLGVPSIPTTGLQAFSQVPATVHFTLGSKFVKDIAAGTFHSLAVVGTDGTSATGTVNSWGYNAFGQLGDITDLTHPVLADRTAPVQVVDTNGTPLTGITHVAAGGSHSLALTSDGRVYAWGDNNYDQLGVSHLENNTGYRPAADLVQYQPVANGPVIPLDHVIQITAGGSTSYALRDDGTVWAWGYNGYGQLGLPGSPSLFPGAANPVLSQPRPVKINLGGSAAQISAGVAHLLIRMSNGTVKAIGYNAYSQLGNGLIVSSYVPVTVAGISDAGNIIAFGNHSLAFAKKAGDTTRKWYGWGDNGFGELGNPISTTSIGYLTVPTRVQGF